MLIQAKNQKISIAINPNLFRYEGKIDLDKNISEVYYPLIKNLLNADSKSIAHLKLRSLKGQRLTFVEIERLFVNDIYDNLISISNIIFNQNYDQAVAIGALNLGKLNTGVVLYMFDKKNGKFRIKKYCPIHENRTLAPVCDGCSAR